MSVECAPIASKGDGSTIRRMISIQMADAAARSAHHFRKRGNNHMFTWNVYLEPSDTDEEARLIGTIQADTMAQALAQAAQYYEYPSHDLVVRRRESE